MNVSRNCNEKLSSENRIISLKLFITMNYDETLFSMIKGKSKCKLIESAIIIKCKKSYVYFQIISVS